MESMFTHNGPPRFVFDRRTVDEDLTKYVS